MKTKIFLLLTTCILLLNACYEDIGHYDYKPSNAVDLSRMYPANTNANLGMEYIFDPGSMIIYSKLEREGEFEYWWEYIGTNDVNGSATKDEVETVCTGKILKVTPNKVGELRYRFCVKEVSTGVITSNYIQIKVISPYSKGWIVLSELNSKSSLSFILPDYNMATNPKTRIFSEYKDLYNNLFKDAPLGTGPIAVRQTLTSSKSTIMVLQNSGSLSLNGESWEKTVDLKSEFAIQQYPEGFSPKDYYYGTRIDVLISQNGYAYSRNYREQAEYMSAFHVKFFSHIPEEVNGVKVTVDKTLETLASQCGFYGLADNVHGLIYWVGSASWSDGLFFKIPMTPAAGQIDINNFDGYKLLFGGGYGPGYYYSNYVTVFKKGNEVVVQTFKVDEWNSYTIQNVTARDVSATMNVNDESKFYMMKTKEYLFYTSGNQVYLYTVTTGDSKAVYTIGAGEKIVGLALNPQESELGVATESGTIAIVNIADFNNISETSKFSGYGKIIDFQYKYNNYFTYSSGRYYGD